MEPPHQNIPEIKNQKLNTLKTTQHYQITQEITQNQTNKENKRKLQNQQVNSISQTSKIKISRSNKTQYS